MPRSNAWYRNNLKTKHEPGNYASSFTCDTLALSYKCIGGDLIFVCFFLYGNHGSSLSSLRVHDWFVNLSWVLEHRDVNNGENGTLYFSAVLHFKSFCCWFQCFRWLDPVLFPAVGQQCFICQWTRFTFLWFSETEVVINFYSGEWNLQQISYLGSHLLQ